jgi:hypothetical protein
MPCESIYPPSHATTRRPCRAGAMGIVHVECCWGGGEGGTGWGLGQGCACGAAFVRAFLLLLDKVGGRGGPRACHHWIWTGWAAGQKD